MPNSAVTKIFTRDETTKWLAGLEKRFASAEVLCESVDGKLLIIRSPYKRHWSVPGGIVDAGETPKIAAIRETLEEVDIILDPETVTFQMVVDRVLGNFGHTYQFIFSAYIDEVQAAGIRLRQDEVIEYAFVTKDEVRAADRDASRPYGATIYDWASDQSGYGEKVFSERTSS